MLGKEHFGSAAGGDESEIKSPHEEIERNNEIRYTRNAATWIYEFGIDSAKEKVDEWVTKNIPPKAQVERLYAGEINRILSIEDQAQDEPTALDIAVAELITVALDINPEDFYGGTLPRVCGDNISFRDRIVKAMGLASKTEQHKYYPKNRLHRYLSDIRRNSPERNQLFYDAYRYVKSVPGTCVHISTQLGLREVLELFSKGESLLSANPKDEHGFMAHGERALSLHITPSSGISSEEGSDYSLGNAGCCGIILKPEFYFKKIMGYSERDLELAIENDRAWGEKSRKQGTHVTRRMYDYGSLYMALAVQNDILGVGPKIVSSPEIEKMSVIEIGSRKPLEARYLNDSTGEEYISIHPDWGIRAWTVMDGYVQPIPIRPEDISCYVGGVEGGWTFYNRHGEEIDLETIEKFSQEWREEHPDS